MRVTARTSPRRVFGDSFGRVCEDFRIGVLHWLLSIAVFESYIQIEFLLSGSFDWVFEGSVSRLFQLNYFDRIIAIGFFNEVCARALLSAGRAMANCIISIELLELGCVCACACLDLVLNGLFDEVCEGSLNQAVRGLSVGLCSGLRGLLKSRILIDVYVSRNSLDRVHEGSLRLGYFIGLIRSTEDLHLGYFGRFLE